MMSGKSGARSNELICPVGQNLFGFVPVRSREPSKMREKSVREKSNFSCRFNAILLVQIFRKKYSAFRFIRTVSSLMSSRLMQRGVRVVTIRGVRAAMDAKAAQDERRLCGRRSRVVLALQCRR
jgi:hypothetical protein